MARTLQTREMDMIRTLQHHNRPNWEKLFHEGQNMKLLLPWNSISASPFLISKWCSTVKRLFFTFLLTFEKKHIYVVVVFLTEVFTLPHHLSNFLLRSWICDLSKISWKTKIIDFLCSQFPWKSLFSSNCYYDKLLQRVFHDKCRLTW